MKFVFIIISIILVQSCNLQSIIKLDSNNKGVQTKASFERNNSLFGRYSIDYKVSTYDTTVTQLKLNLYDINFKKILPKEVEVVFFSINNITLSFLQSGDDAIYDKDKTIRFYLSKNEHDVLVKEGVKGSYIAKLVLMVRGKKIIFDIEKK